MKANRYHILRAIFITLAIIFVVPAMAQNTKGDRPLNNRGKVRETKGKAIKKKNRVTTKDIADRATTVTVIAGPYLDAKPQPPPPASWAAVRDSEVAMTSALPIRS